MKWVNPQDRKRLFFVSLGIVALFALLTVHYFKIQVIEREKWEKEARKQHYFILKEPFKRGTFYSNTAIKKGHPEKEQRLVVDIEKFHLFIDPESIPAKRKKELASVLIRLLDLSKEESLNLWSQFQKKSRSRKVATWLDKEMKETILEWWNPYAHKHKIPRNAIFFQTDYQRSYPFKKLLGQVLHTVQNAKDEITDQSLPTGGLELYFNQYLKGKIGKRRLMRSPRNALETGEILTYPDNGADVYLTINHALQSIAEEELEKGVKKCKAKAGWAVMMDPKTGEILALAQYPFFYPENYQEYFNDPLLIENTKVKAVTDANEIGSVMKSITCAVALLANKELEQRGEKPLFSVDEKIATSNGRFPGRKKHITDTHLHSFLNMDMAIQHSSNIYVARLVERIIARLGADWYRRVLNEVFGFSVKTGIELPSESPGVLPTPGKKHPNGTFEWSTPTPFSMAFGHNLQANSIQLLRAYSLLANGGYWVNPTLIKKIVKKLPDGKEEILYSHPPQEKVQVLDSQIAKRIVQAMKYSTKKGGTCWKGDIWGYTEAGKSSTAKKIVNGTYSETRYIGSFMGLTPTTDPAFVMIVSMDEPEYAYIPGIGKNHNGGTCSAPVFRDIARRSLEYLGIAPDDPFGYPNGDPRSDRSKADWMQETKILDDLYEKWNHKKESHVIL